jgi:hypothetical protein
MSIPRWLRKLLPDRRPTSPRRPVFVPARLELDVVDVEGSARDVAPGGVFFATSAPIATGVRGCLRRSGSAERIPVRVTWHRPAGPGGPAGLGLAFE